MNVTIRAEQDDYVHFFQSIAPRTSAAERQAVLNVG